SGAPRSSWVPVSGMKHAADPSPPPGPANSETSSHPASAGRSEITAAETNLLTGVPSPSFSHDPAPESRAGRTQTYWHPMLNAVYTVGVAGTTMNTTKPVGDAATIGARYLPTDRPRPSTGESCVPSALTRAK